MVVLAASFIVAAPSPAGAYSYGDPDKEDVAETYKLIEAELAENDWDAALAAYQVRRAEIESHFGKDVALTLDANFRDKNKALVLQNYRYILYMNLDRRFTYAEQNINNYAQASLLLAKAKGTFDVLKPYLEIRIPNQIQEIRDHFDKAYESLGNPGLFNLGKKPVDVEAYRRHTSAILTTLKPLFAYTPATGAAGASPGRAASPAPSSTPAPSARPTAAGSPSSPNDASPTSPASAADAASPSPGSGATPSPAAAVASPDAAALGTGSAEAPPEPSQKAPEPGVSAEHAPMQRTDRTNPFVTAGAIVGLLLVASGVVWWTKRQAKG
ncbi:MAG: hypothetical protein BLM47_02665 [Candidatus Reconcilbacillus cellulovorans]|uniref:Gram-positive cocci surface proteins LPxTG domain-containing protein n=1 Tax=Candidatus Reconcilbacillus cellulovorans TaxID=1906605 RepID=A0A2A6E3N5_9BACL|nr:MAG: hypothetical protein BLM47_02665 [Candidatus Reconcilbacillus cellulovorans]